MKRPVWRYSQEAVTDAPFDLVRARLEGLAQALPLSVCAPRSGAQVRPAWQQDGFTSAQEVDGWLVRRWTASQGSMHEEASFSVRKEGQGCQLRTEGRLKGWPLLWKVGLLGWRSEGLLVRFIRSIT